MAMSAVCKVNGAEVNVHAAASLTDVMKEIGDKILFSFGASSLLARQIINRQNFSAEASRRNARAALLRQAVQQNASH
jgi:ABC-type molybdate transport system substrate-binding protein